MPGWAHDTCWLTVNSSSSQSSTSLLHGLPYPYVPQTPPSPWHPMHDSYPRQRSARRANKSISVLRFLRNLFLFSPHITGPSGYLSWGPRRSRMPWAWWNLLHCTPRSEGRPWPHIIEVIFDFIGAFGILSLSSVAFGLTARAWRRIHHIWAESDSFG